MSTTPPLRASAGHLTITEACLVLGVSSASLVERVRDGTLPCRRVRGGEVLLSAQDVAALAEHVGG